MAWVDLGTCSLSRWKGDERRCRWCDKGLQGRQRAWCGKKCMRAFRVNHYYVKARAESLRRARGPCSCDIVSRRIKHSSCSQCGKCEAVLMVQGSRLECNHIKARVGDRSTVSCMHHQENLEILCSVCHLAVTAGQRSQGLLRVRR